MVSWDFHVPVPKAWHHGVLRPRGGVAAGLGWAVLVVLVLYFYMFISQNQDLCIYIYYYIIYCYIYIFMYWIVLDPFCILSYCAESINLFIVL